MNLSEIRKEKEKLKKEIQKLCLYFFERTEVDIVNIKVLRVPFFNDDELSAYSTEITLDSI